MTYHCFVPGCETKISRNENMMNKEGITLHKLPGNNMDLEIWLKILNCEHLPVSSSTNICSKHFRNYAFTTDSNLRRCLRRTATPFLPDYTDNQVDKRFLLAMIGQQNDTSLKENQRGAKLTGLDRSRANRANNSKQVDAKQTYNACMQMKGERDYLFKKLEEEVTKKFINIQSCKGTGKCTDSGAKCPHEEMLTEAICEVARLNQTILEMTRREEANEGVMPAHECVEATYENGDSETESPQLPNCDDAEPMSLGEDYSRGPDEEQPRQVNPNLVCRWDESGKSRLCGEMFPTVKDLTTHVTAHVTDRSDTKRQCCWEGCPMTGNKFRFTDSLIRHMYMHTGQVVYRCRRKGCSKTFTKHHLFKKHVWTHSGRVYTCKYQDCGMEFTGTASLVVHVRRDHTGEKPFGCPFDGCKETFVAKMELNSHVRTHHADEIKTKRAVAKTET